MEIGRIVRGFKGEKRTVKRNILLHESQGDQPFHVLKVEGAIFSMKLIRAHVERHGKTQRGVDRLLLPEKLTKLVQCTVDPR